MFDKSKKLAIGCDHAAIELKTFIKNSLEAEGYQLEDFGTNSTESVDYPDIIHPLASKIDKGEIEKGIIMCGSGNGVSMVANKYQGVRAALCWNSEQAKLTRMHNDANIISMPGRFIAFEEALKAVKLFLETDFEGGRHQKRVDKIARKN